MLNDRSTRWKSADLELLTDNGNRSDVLTSPLLPNFQQSIAEVFSTALD
jgi:hypothetical protein